MSELFVKAHLFICTNQREEGKPCCAKKSSFGLRKRLKDWAKAEFQGQVKVTASGCLGHCSQGIVTVLYPHQQWRLNVNETNDEEVLKNAIRNALQPVCPADE